MGYYVINHRKERYDIKTSKGRVQLAGRSAARSGRHDAGAHRAAGEAAGELLPLRPALGRVLPRITARGLRPPNRATAALSSEQASAQARTRTQGHTHRGPQAHGPQARESRSLEKVSGIGDRRSRHR